MAKRGPKKRKKVFSTFENNEFGEMRAVSRAFQDKTFPVWSAVQYCEFESCIAANMCPYSGTGGAEKKCTVMMRYMKKMETMIYGIYGDKLTEDDLFRIGMHLVPLYKQLVRLKIVEMSIFSTGMMEVAKSGVHKIHPIFKEMRDCIRTIDSTWREIGIGKKDRPESPVIPLKPAKDYYEEMEMEATEEGKALKLVRRNNGKTG